MNCRDEGVMAQNLRDCGDVCEATLRAIIEALMQPTCVMVSAGWDSKDNGYSCPTYQYRAMLQVVLDELVDPMKQHADTNGMAKLQCMLAERRISKPETKF